MKTNPKASPKLWRMLKFKQAIKDGDEYCFNYNPNRQNQWFKSFCQLINRPTVVCIRSPMALPIAAACVRAAKGAKMKANLKAHNPDRIPPEQLKKSIISPWRLLDVDEIKKRKKGYQQIEAWMKDTWHPDWCGNSLTITYRTQLTREELAKLT